MNKFTLLNRKSERISRPAAKAGLRGIFNIIWLIIKGKSKDFHYLRYSQKGIGEELLAKVGEVITKTNFDDEFMGFPEILKRIIYTGFIACAHRDVELSCVIGTKIVATSPWANSEYNVGNIVQALLIAGAAFQKEGEWAEWLEKQLAEVAYRLPAGEKTKEFLSHIQELKKVLNIKMGILSKAEAIASAAT